MEKNNFIEELLIKIKSKKELKFIDESFVLSIIKKIESRYPLSSNFRKKEEKLFIKEVRSELRRSAGMFQANIKDRNYLLKEENFDKILESHTSTKERLSNYPELRKILKDLKVKIILDIGCGLNPIALASNIYYYNACDIRKDELLIIEKYFKENNIKGKVFVFDISSSDISILPKSDIAILWKVLDILPKKYDIYKLLSDLKCDYIWVSFATKTLSGKKMNSPNRRWFENILKRLNYSSNILLKENEIFYLIKKPMQKQA